MLISIIAVVSIAFCQKIGCKNPIKKVQKPTKTVVFIFLPLAKYAIAVTPKTTVGHGAKIKKFLRKFLTDQGKIIPAHVTGVSAKYQRMLTREIKKARILALLPFIVDPREN